MKVQLECNDAPWIRPIKTGTTEEELQNDCQFNLHQKKIKVYDVACKSVLV